MIVVILVLCYTLLYIRYLNFSSYDIEEQTYSDYRVVPILKKASSLYNLPFLSVKMSHEFYAYLPCWF